MGLRGDFRFYVGRCLYCEFVLDSPWLRGTNSLLSFFCKAVGSCPCQFLQIILSIVSAPKHRGICCCRPNCNFLPSVDEIETSNHLLVSFQSEYLDIYIPYKLTMLITSSISPTLRSASYLVLAVIEGPPFTSSNQALPSLSKMKSNP